MLPYVYKIIRRKLTTYGLRHQKEALDFISQREFGPVPAQFSLWKDITEHGDAIQGLYIPIRGSISD